MAIEEEFASWIELSQHETIRFGDLAGLMGAALHGDTFAAAAAQINLEDELPKLVRAGILKPRDPLTNGPHPFPYGDALNNAQLRADEELRVFLADRGIGLRILPAVAVQTRPAIAAGHDNSEADALADAMSQKRVEQACLGIGPEEGVPHFVVGARPDAVPTELMALPPDARITTEHDLAGMRGSGTARAGDLRSHLEAVIQRQREGYFTLVEAAQALADARPETSAKEALKRFLIAHANKALPVHLSGSRFLAEHGEPVSDWHDLLYVPELDAWLRKTTGYGFPHTVVSACVDETVQAVPKIAEASVTLPEGKLAKRSAVLAMFRQEGGKRPSEGRGKWGALAAVARRTGIDKDTLAAMLDKAIEEKRHADAFAQLAANR